MFNPYNNQGCNDYDVINASHGVHNPAATHNNQQIQLATQQTTQTGLYLTYASICKLRKTLFKFLSS